MEIINKKPPIWEEAHRHFKIDDEKTVYTYDGKLYNPAGVPIDDALMFHEETHVKQQKELEGGAKAWWEKYFIDPDFRMKQEFAAYRNQYLYFCTFVTHDRNQQARFLYNLALDLAGPMYHVGTTHANAMRIIKNGK